MSGRIGPAFVGNVIRDGLVVYLNAGIVNSYPYSGQNWYDISGYGNDAILATGATTYPTYYANPARIKLQRDRGIGVAVVLPGNSYTYPTNFTWQIWHYYNSADIRALNGLFWSEVTSILGLSKNFLFLYQNVDANTYGPYPFARIDTKENVYWSYDYTIFNGGFNSALTDRWELTTIIKDGTTFSWYWGDVLKWQVSIGDWSIEYPTQQIFIGNINSFTYPSIVDIGQVMMYDRVLSNTEITYNYNNTKTRFGI
jgi:hypothetical protein